MRDKKYRHGIRFVVLNALGRPESGVTAADATLEQVLSDLANSKSLPETASEITARSEATANYCATKRSESRYKRRAIISVSASGQITA
jgi:hypothetical protein